MRPGVETPGPRHTIGEAARRIGVSASALRAWERQGLVRPARTRARYRLYSEADLEHLRRVRRMRQDERINAPGIRRVLRDAVVSPHADERRVDGRPLRRLRHRLGLSLRQSAEMTGLSIGFLSALERSLTGASIATLQRVTAAYGTTLSEVFGAPASSERLVRAGERPVLRLGESSVRIEQLARGATQLEPQLFVLAPRATSDGAYAHDGEEFIYLLAGAMTVWVGDTETHHLSEPGDALTFPSNLPHRWRNDASGETRLLWINTPPTF